MITLKQITEEMGEVWVSQVQEQAKHIYHRMENRDLSKREYVNSSVRRAYDSVQQAKVKPKGSLSRSAEFLGGRGL